MTNWYYYNDGKKHGPITSSALKALAEQGVITSTTPLETESGRKGPAGKVPGLFNAAPSNPFTTPMAVQNQAMPQSVPISDTKGNKSSLWITVVGVLLIACVGLGGWWVIKQSSPPGEQTAKNVSNLEPIEPDNGMQNVPADDSGVSGDEDNFADGSGAMNGSIGDNMIGEFGRFTRSGAGRNPPGQPAAQPQPRPEPPLRSIDIRGGRNFSDGVAWLWPRGDSWFCVDKTGKTVLRLGQDSPHSNFSHGVALVIRRDSNQTVELIDKSGKVISSPKSGEYDQITGFIPDIGMILVHKRIDTFQLTEDRVGVIDSSGNWKVPLINDPVLVAVGKAVSPAIFLQGGNSPDREVVTSGMGALRRYPGEGFFTWSSGRNQDFFFNIATGTRGTLSMSISDSVSEFGDPWRPISKGYGVRIMQNTVFRIDTSGKATPIINLPQNADSTGMGDYSEGLFYLYASVRQSNAPLISGFYDITGKLIIDLRQYNLSTGGYGTWAKQVKFSDGYCVLRLLNPQGVGYWSVIDKTGKMMFTPKRYLQQRTGGDIRVPDAKCGMIVINSNLMNTQLSLSTIIDASTGDVVLELGEGFRVFDYSEDAALVKSNSEVYYIDKAGKRLF